MTAEQVSKRIWTIPNVVSFIRLAAIPFFWWLLLGEDNVAAATLLFVVIATTDWIDGYLARRLGQVSELGKALDPIADRLMIASAIVAGLIANIVPPVIGWGLIAREVYMALMAVTLVARRGVTLEVRWLGKGATLLVYSAIGWFYIAAIPFLDWLLVPLAWVAGSVGLVLYWITAIQYTGDARRAGAALKSAPDPEES